VALEWDGKGQGTQWPNMAVEVDVSEKEPWAWDQGVEEKEGPRCQDPQLTVHSPQSTVRVLLLNLTD
jgi:hypothetical protein